MKIGFVVNDLLTEKVNYTTTRLAYAAHEQGHEVWYIDVSGFAFDADDTIGAHAAGPSKSRHESAETFLQNIQSGQAVKKRVSVESLDVLMLRNDPAEDVVKRPWARMAPIYFGRLAAIRGVIVLNDPDGLTHAINKSYLEFLPQSVRPLSVITRSEEDIASFGRELGSSFVLKPLTGSGGHNVFLIPGIEDPNFRQIVGAVLDEGYALAQEYVAGAQAGDTRLFLMNGRILEVGGQIAAIRRVPSTTEFRSNMSVGAKAELAERTDELLAIAEQVGPQLVSDGLFLVGLDIMGDKLIEVNVFSPGGFYGAGRLTGVDFFPLVIDAIEKKVSLRKQEPGRFSNREIATL